MARTPDAILREIIGQLAVQYAVAQSQAEVCAERAAVLEAEAKAGKENPEGE